MEADSSRVTSKGQVVIPKKLRKKYDIAPSMMIRWIPREEGLLMVPETGDVIKAARGMLKGSNLLKAYLKEKNWKSKRRIKNLVEENSYVLDSFALIGYLENEPYVRLLFKDHNPKAGQQKSFAFIRNRSKMIKKPPVVDRTYLIDDNI